MREDFKAVQVFFQKLGYKKWEVVVESPQECTQKLIYPLLTTSFSRESPEKTLKKSKKVKKSQKRFDKDLKFDILKPSRAEKSF